MSERNRRLTRTKWPYLFISPFFLIYGVFGLFPILFTLYISLTSWSILSPPKFVGLKNYIFVFTRDPLFLRSIGNVLLFSVIVIPLLLGFGIMLAELLRTRWLRAKGMFRLAIFSPYLTTPVAIGILFALIFDWNNGILNRILLSIGVLHHGYDWLGYAGSARTVVIMMLFWKYVGYNMMFYVAGMSRISPEIYEAAIVDGAGAVRTFFRITVPLLAPISLFLLITSIIGGMQLFEEPLLLLSGWVGQSGQSAIAGPDNSCLTPIWHLYNLAFGAGSLQFGRGSAVAYATFIFIAVFSFFGIRVMGRRQIGPLT